MNLELLVAGSTDADPVKWTLHAAVGWTPERSMPPIDIAMQHPEIVRYHKDWMRPGDLGVVATVDGAFAGMAFARLFTAEDQPRPGAGLAKYRRRMPISVVLAEDSFIVREGVRMLLEEAGYDLLATAENYDELIAAVEAHIPDVVITDIRMPPTQTDEGVQAARRIRAEHPEIGVVVLSQYVEPSYALSLFDDGSAGIAYLLKEKVGDIDQLADAIARVAEGGSVLDPLVIDALVQARIRRESSRLKRLTPRETEVLAEIASGKSNAAIAATLFLSERAIEKHINSIFTKLDLPVEADSNRRVRAVLLYLAETD
jgi:DNA-binding NarL/FixJ family response regulator